MSDKLVDVRGVIDRSSRVATLKELADQGKKKVKVVNTSQITQLISEAVHNVVARRAMTLAEKERAQLVKDSNEEFRKILAERESDRQGQARLSEQVESLKRELETRKREFEVTARRQRDELETLRSQGDVADSFREKVEVLQAQVKDLLRKGEDDLRAADGYRREAAGHKESVEKLERQHEEDVRSNGELREQVRSQQKRIEELTNEITAGARRREAELAAAREQGGVTSGAVASLQSDIKSLLRAQSESQELIRDQAKQLKEYEARIAVLTDQLSLERSASVPADALAALAGQFAELKQTIDKRSEESSVAAGAVSSLEKLVADKMEAIQKNIALKVENITFKPKEASVEETSLVLDRIFDHQAGLESNIQNVAVKEEQQGGIGDSLKRLKSMKGT